MLCMSEWRRENILPWALLAVMSGIHIILGLDKSRFLCIIAVLASVAVFCRWLNAHFKMAWFNWAGRNTLQIYVIHRIFIEFFGQNRCASVRIGG